jgi:lysozyme family protein
MTFDDAFDRLMGHEGILSLDPEDAGNWTGGGKGLGELRGSKYGVSAASYATLNIKALTRDDAKVIFRRDFWSRINADKLPDGVAWQLADYAYNSGVETAIRHFQRALGVADDGRWGPVSQAAADMTSESDAIMRLVAERLDYLSRLVAWTTQGRGWARRLANDLRYGAEDS